MPTTGQRLARVQYESHLAIDAILAPAAERIEALILRYAVPDPDDIPRIRLGSRPAILSAIGAELDRLRPELLAAILAAVNAAEIAATEDGETSPDPALAAVPAETWRALGTDRGSVVAQSGALLAAGIAGKLAAKAVAKRVRDYFSPFFSPRRDAGGVVRRGETRPGSVASWPGRSGMASAHPRLAMLTETTAAHARQTRLIAERDGMGLKWNLSPQHAGSDECDANATRDVGFGAGVYPIAEFPPLPTHPRCRCWAEAVELVAR